MTDPIESPGHYTKHAIQPLDVVDDWDLPYHLGCAIKYISRYRYKDDPIGDLRKARQYMTFYIDRLLAETKNSNTIGTSGYVNKLILKLSCSSPGCAKRPYRDGLCWKHYLDGEETP